MARLGSNILAGAKSGQIQAKGGASVFAARVRGIILNDKDYPKVFKDNQEWASIGSIFFERMDSPNPNFKFTENSLAKPLNPNIKYIPLVNEVVYIFSFNASTKSENDPGGNVVYYYLNPINIWGGVTNNALPDGGYNSQKPESQRQNYLQASQGSPNVVNSNTPSSLFLGNTFQDKSSIKNLQPFEGDVLHEGRWGQSLRFGSTIKNSNPQNNWSKVGDNGDPILIIKNGQQEETDVPFGPQNDPWIPQIEDINKDKSSIYLTSTQEIPIEVSSTSYNSYGTSQPIAPNKFSGEQVILNSGRLLFNSKTDSILFSSKESINLNAISGSVNIDTPKTIIQSGEVLLGNQNATEPIILGDKFLTDFNLLLTDLIALCTALPTVGTITPGVPNVLVTAEATKVLVRAQSIQGKIQSYKSKVTKSK